MSSTHPHPRRRVYPTSSTDEADVFLNSPTTQSDAEEDDDDDDADAVVESEEQSGADALPDLIPILADDETDNMSADRRPIHQTMQDNNTYTTNSASTTSTPSSTATSTPSPSPPSSSSSSSSSSSLSSSTGTALSAPSASRSGPPERTLSGCVSDYSCCLRYRASISACCTGENLPTSANAITATTTLSSTTIQSLLPYVPFTASWLQSHLLLLALDEETRRFLQACERDWNAPFYSAWKLKAYLVKPLLSRCLSHTDLNGLLAMGQMALCSTAQFDKLLKTSWTQTQTHAHAPAAATAAAAAPHTPLARIHWTGQLQTSTQFPWMKAASSSSQANGVQSHSRLLDVGAGDGNITSKLQSFVNSVVATEVAPQMIKRLQARGFKAILTGDLDELEEDDGFELIALFNVIDRCSKPHTLLKQIQRRLKDENSRLLLAVPLPLNPWVEKRGAWVRPEEPLPRPPGRCQDWAASLCVLSNFLMEMGFQIEAFSRVPYLSQGDPRRAFYVLDDVMFCLSTPYHAKYHKQQQQKHKH